MKTRTIRVYTHKKTKEIVYRGWSDGSPEVEGLDDSKLTRLYCTLTLGFAKEKHIRILQKRKQKFIKANNKDVQYEFEEINFLPGMKKHSLSFNGRKSGCLKCAAGYWLYIFATLFMFNWILRFCLFQRSHKLEYNFVKVVHKI